MSLARRRRARALLAWLSAPAHPTVRLTNLQVIAWNQEEAWMGGGGTANPPALSKGGATMRPPVVPIPWRGLALLFVLWLAASLIEGASR